MANLYPNDDACRPAGQGREQPVAPARPDAALWRLPDIRAALAIHDISTVFRLLGKHRISQRRIAALVGIAQSEVAEIAAGRRVLAYHLLVKIADGLGIPRIQLGLADPPPVERDQARPVDVLAAHEVVVTRWTGAHSHALRLAMRYSVREFAQRLGVDERTVSKWGASGATVVPHPVNQAALDTMLTRADPPARQRFASIVDALSNPPTQPPPRRGDRVEVHLRFAPASQRQAVELADTLHAALADLTYDTPLVSMSVIPAGHRDGEPATSPLPSGGGARRCEHCGKTPVIEIDKPGREEPIVSTEVDAAPPGPQPDRRPESPLGSPGRDLPANRERHASPRLPHRWPLVSDNPTNLIGGSRPAESPATEGER